MRPAALETVTGVAVALQADNPYRRRRERQSLPCSARRVPSTSPSVLLTTRESSGSTRDVKADNTKSTNAIAVPPR